MAAALAVPFRELKLEHGMNFPLVHTTLFYSVIMPKCWYNAATTRYVFIIFICCLCCSADGSYEVKLLTKAIVYHSGDILWQPPAIYKGRITSGILLRSSHS